jgi:hypothetical protein
MGGMGIMTRGDPALFFLFFRGAAGGEFDRRARPAPLKNKKKEGVAGLVP